MPCRSLRRSSGHWGAQPEAVVGEDDVDGVADALGGRDTVTQRHVDDRVPGAGGEGEQAREPVQPVVVAAEHPDGIGGAQGGVAQGVPGLDDPVRVRARPGPELAQSQPHVRCLMCGASWQLGRGPQGRSATEIPPSSVEASRAANSSTGGRSPFATAS
ncbi:hypothetical protein GCM10010521_03990 [Streptomyces rameus]|uniref:Uncharacterized protein n=1 Tax=Streptomyces rameus TaxID=68261 RepID=A0ABP6MQ15_9ACTN